MLVYYIPLPYRALSLADCKAMESLQDRSSDPQSSTPMRGSQSGKLARVASHTQGLVEDLREWIDLRLDLVVLDLEEKVNDLKNQVGQGIVLALLGFFTALFALVTVALGVGWLLGHPFWGFLAVFAVLAIGTAGFAKAKPQLGPPVDLFEALRGDRDREEASAASDDDRPARTARATVDDAS